MLASVRENLWISFGIATPADHRGNTTLGKPLGNVDLLGLGEEFPVRRSAITEYCRFGMLTSSSFADGKLCRARQGHARRRLRGERLVRHHGIRPPGGRRAGRWRGACRWPRGLLAHTSRFQTVVTFTDVESYSTALNVTLNA